VLYRMVRLPETWVTLTIPNTPMSTFYIALRIFVVGEHRDFKYREEVDHGTSQPTDDKYPETGVVMQHDQFLIFGLFKISLERLKIKTSDFVHWLAM